MGIRKIIEAGQTALGIEFGSTRIKAVLVDTNGSPIAAGNHTWENHFVDGIWTYPLEEIWDGLQTAYANLSVDVLKKFGVTLQKVGAIGISAMMHGYLAFDKHDNLLVPFRTWRNTITEQAANTLTENFGFNIPQRWSIAHLYQAMLNHEPHVEEISYITTLAGYIHWQLTGEKVLGIGDASGMFPIDSKSKNYNADMLKKFSRMAEPFNFKWEIKNILPKVLTAGKKAGTLSDFGAKKLDISGNLQAGIPFAPPEGDAGTGMTATNSIAVRTGNVSAGTSIFAMVVLDKPLAKLHREIDMVTTPAGDPVAMVHCNNCTSDINSWANLFKEFSEAAGNSLSWDKIYSTMFESALNGEFDCGDMMSFNYFSGEPVTGFESGRPIFLRNENSRFSFANFMRLQLYSAVAALNYGLRILFDDEKISVEKMYGHGGFFKTSTAGQQIMAAAMNTPVTVMDMAGEGGAWGMALLALYSIYADKEKSLAQFLNDTIFADESGFEFQPDPKQVEGFNFFMQKYVKALPIEKSAIDYF